MRLPLSLPPASRFTGGWLALIVAALLSVASAASAQNLTMKAQTGTGDQYRVGAWLPLQVDISNRGERIEGQLQVAITRTATSRTVTYLKPVDLAKASKQRHLLYVRPEAYLSDLKVTLISGRNRWEAVIDPAKLRVLQPGDFLLYVLDTRQSGLDFLSGMPVVSPGRSGPGSMSPPSRRGNSPPPRRLPSQGGQSQGEARIAYAGDPNDVPDDRRGMDNARMVVVGNFSLDTLSPERLQAIRDWVLSGGTLLVAGGADVRRLQTPALAPFLPVTVTGAHALNREPLGAFNTRLSDAVPAVTTRLKADAVYLNGTGSLVSQKPMGLGKVIFVAFDPTVSGSVDDARALWNGLLMASLRRNPSSPPGAPLGGNSGNFSPPSRTFAELSQDMPSVGAPSFNLLAGYLLLYLLLLSPVNYFLLRRTRRLEWAWVTVPVIILGFTLGAYGTGYAMKGGKLKANQVTHIRAGSGEERAASVTYLSLFSPSRHTYRVEAEDRESVLLPVSGDSDPYMDNPNNAINYTCVQGEKPALEDVGVNMWSVRSFRMDHMVDLGGPIEGRFLFNGTSTRPAKKTPSVRKWVLEGKVSNHSRMQLRGCVLRFGSLLSRPFDLPPGAVKSGPIPLVDRSVSNMSAPPSWNRLSQVSYEQVLSEDTNLLYMSGIVQPTSFGIRLDGREPDAERGVVISVKLPYSFSGGGTP